MAELTCKKCGKKFEAMYLSDEFCDECTALLQDKYHAVRDYLWTHPNTPADVVARECDCSVRQVMRWVREERFTVSDSSKVSLYCENCGKKIFSGYLCATCQNALKQKAADAAAQERAQHHAESMKGVSTGKAIKEDGKMRYL